MVGTKVDAGHVLLTVRYPALIASTDTTQWCFPTQFIPKSGALLLVIFICNAQ